MKLLSKKAKVVSMTSAISKEQMDSYVEEYNRLNEEIKVIDKRKKELAGFIKDYAEKHGSKDDKGSFYCENDSFIYGKQAKTSIVPRENICATLNTMGFSDCIKVVETPNREMIDKYHDEGALTDENIKELFEVKQNTPSVYVKRKEEMPEVEQTTVKKAACRKGRK